MNQGVQDVANGYASDANGPTHAAVDAEPQFLSDFLLTVWRERRFVVKAFAVGLVVAAVISLIIPPKYESTTRIMPPEKQGLGGLAAMLATAGSDGSNGASSLVGGMVSDAMGIKSTGAIYIGVLNSTTVQDALIDEFNLRKVYGTQYEKDARERLADSTEISEDRKSGIISVTVTDRSRERSMQMAKAYVDNLNGLTARLNTSAAHRERVFIEERLKTVKQDLDAASKDLSEFSSKNLTLDVKEQGKAMMEGTAALAGELIAAESELSGLEQIYTSNNVRVRALQARVEELKRKLSELRGSDDDPIPGGEANDFGISIAKLPALGVTYYDLYRRVKIQETVFEILTKQYELAKVQEAKEIPTIKVLDEAQLPETKTSPKRTLMTVLGAFLAAMMAAIYVMVSARLRAMGASHPLSLFGLEMREGLGDDWALLRSRMPPGVLRVVSRIRARTRRDPPSSTAA
ncbi:MAG: GNVR domain-containing protein [Candidatus Sulfotelmatobacter sp.]